MVGAECAAGNVDRGGCGRAGAILFGTARDRHERAIAFRFGQVSKKRMNEPAHRFARGVGGSAEIPLSGHGMQKQETAFLLIEYKLR